MKHIIRLFILIAALVLGTDYAWADAESNPRVNFVYVDGDNYALTSDKGFAFASDETTGEVTITVNIFDGQDYRCIEGDLTAEQSINSNMGQARRRTSAEGPGNGVPVDVNCTKTNEFTLTLPEDESTNVTVYVRFSEKLLLIITADDLSVYWGSIAAPEFTVSCDGFQEGDDISKLEGTLTIDCDYSVDSEIGVKYAITPSGLTSADYAIYFQRGVLTVKEVIVKVSVVDAINVKLDGAYVQVLDGEERVDFWTSGGSAYKIDGLKAGKTYTLRETAAPEGYMIPSDITFTIDAEGKVATTGTTTTDEEGNTVLVLKNRRLLTHNNISVEAIDDQTWTGSAITPAVVVKDGEMDITDQCDISYSDNTDAGQATITITAKDGSDYAGSTTVHFLIYIRFEKDGITYEWTREMNVKVTGYNGTLSSLVIPVSVDHNGVSYNVTEIGQEAFKDNNSLVSIDLLPEAGHITIIGARAFKGCTGLSEIVLPVGLRNIEEETFSGSGLTEITIPACVESIGDYAFAGCSGLTEITIPASVESIGENAFEGCNENLIIYVPEDNVDFYRDLLPAYAAIILPESAKGAVPYIDADGKMAYCTDYTVLNGSTEGVKLGSDGVTTWYVVNSDVEYKQIKLVGDVNLILCDGKTMTADGGSASAIMGVYGYSNSLTIYGQTAGTGELKAYSGEGNGIQSNAITINGGSVNATGGGYFDISAGGNVTINGGNVSANGSSGGIKAGGDIILGWTNNTDRIYASSFSAVGTISIADGKAFTDGTNVYTSATSSDDLKEALNKSVTLIPKKDIAACTATADNPMYHDGYNIGMFYDGTWNSNHGGIKVFDGETELTYYHYDANLDDFVGDYRTSVVSLDYPDDNPCTRVGEHCQLILTGENSWAGTLTIDIEIQPLTGNGTWGDNDELTWNYADGTLNINLSDATGGNKAMKEADNYGKYPWYQYCSHITTISIGEGVTSIADNAFGSQPNIYTYNNVAKVTIPASVTSIGADAFKGCITATDVYCYADPTKLTWGDTGDDFKSGDEKTTCHVFNTSNWSTFNLVNVTFVGGEEGGLGSSTCPVELTEGEGVNLLTGLAKSLEGRSDIPSGTTLSVTFSRTFDTNTVGEGKATTVCLPYAVTTPDASVGTFYTFGGVTESGGVYTVTMNAVAAGTTTTAGTPYLFKPAGGSAVPFSGQIAIAETYSEGNAPSTDGWEFRGTFEKITWAKGQTRLYGFAAADFETSDGTQIDATEIGSFRRYGWGYCDAFRCYLWAPNPSTVRGVSKSGSLPETLRVVLVGANGQTTAIGTLDARTGDVTFDSDAWYTLDGTRLDTKPTKSGVYIHNSKKVIIK